MSRLSARTHSLVIGYVLLSVALIVLALFAHANPYFAWDLQWEIAWQAKKWPGLASVMYGLTWLGDDWHPYVVVVLVAGALALKGMKKTALAIVACAAGGEIFGFIIKVLVKRPRPAADGLHIMRHRHTLSFPSGHVTHFVVFYGFLFVLAFLYMRSSPGRTIILIILALLLVSIGFSRVYVGEHWPSDVLGGYLTGLCWLVPASMLYQRRSRHLPSASQDTE